MWGHPKGHSVRCGGIPSGILKGTLWLRGTLWGWKASQGTHCGVGDTSRGTLCGVGTPRGTLQGLIALAELRAQQEPDLKGKAAAHRDSVLGLGPTFRKVKAVHLSSSVPSGHSMRPTKQAFQISSTKSG